MNLLARGALVLAVLLFVSSSAPRVGSQTPQAPGVEAQKEVPCLCSASPPQGHVGAPPTGAPSDPTSYDEQVGATFTQSFITMAYNITAVEQSDPISGAGPAYLLNGLSETGYWYQVGLSWNWTPGYTPGTGFDLIYEVWDPSGNSIYPTNGGGGLQVFSGPVQSGDTVLLNLYFSSTYGVVMLVKDYTTGASAYQTYSAHGASQFIGLSSNTADSNGYFTGLMTEWYHSSPFYGNISPVKYSNPGFPLTSAWMWTDEFSCSDVSCSNRTTLFIDSTPGPVSFANPTQVHEFSSNGLTAYADAYSFTTGAIGKGLITLSYSVVGGGSGYGSPVLTYVADGVRQQATLTGTPQTYLADLGSGWGVASGLPGNTTTERWQTGQQTSGALTSSVTVILFYYHQFLCTFEFNVVGGGHGYLPPAIQVAQFGIPLNLAAGTSWWVDSGSSYSYSGTLEGSSLSERWTSTSVLSGVITQSVDVASVSYFHQFGLAIHYTVAGGGPSQNPDLIGTQFGQSFSDPVSNSTIYFLDAGSSWSAPSRISGSTPQERWIALAPVNGSATTYSSVTLSYQHQYLLTVVSSPVEGGSTLSPGWEDAGAAVQLSQTPSQGWKFEGWSGEGNGAYTGQSNSTSIDVNSPMNETAMFYPGLEISSGDNGQVSWSFGTQTGTVPAGRTQAIYAPPGTTVALQAIPGSFLFSFAGWAGAANGTEGVTSVDLSSPAALTATFSLNTLLLGGIAGAVVVAGALAAFAVRARRKSAS